MAALISGKYASEIQTNKKEKKMRLGALEAGGTKMVCAIGDETGKIEERISIPTKTPQETIPLLIDFYQKEGLTPLGSGALARWN